MYLKIINFLNTFHNKISAENARSVDSRRKKKALLNELNLFSFYFYLLFGHITRVTHLSSEMILVL